MAQKNEIETEILNIFYPAFVKAIAECWMQQKKLKIIKEVPGNLNSQLITVRGKNAIDFFTLGKLFATYRAEM